MRRRDRELSAEECAVLQASQLYTSATFDQLARLMSVDVKRAECIAAQMISEDRVEAHIDQVNSTIFFCCAFFVFHVLFSFS